MSFGVKRITFHMPTNLLEKLNCAVKQKYFSSRAEAIRIAIYLMLIFTKNINQ